MIICRSQEFSILYAYPQTKIATIIDRHSLIIVTKDTKGVSIIRKSTKDKNKMAQKEQKDKQRSTKQTHITKDRVT